MLQKIQEFFLNTGTGHMILQGVAGVSFFGVVVLYMYRKGTAQKEHSESGRAPR